MQSLGIPAELQKRQLDIRAHYRTVDSTSCFSAAARYEVLVEGRKLVGSAQRRLAEGVLQHGSILLGHTHQYLPDYLLSLNPEEKEKLRKTMAEKTVTIADCLPSNIGYRSVQDAIKEALAVTLSLRFEDGEPTEAERKRIGELREVHSIMSKAPGRVREKTPVH
jgi:lipoate-protein ligase A